MFLSTAKKKKIDPKLSRAFRFSTNVEIHGSQDISRTQCYQISPPHWKVSVMGCHSLLTTIGHQGRVPESTSALYSKCSQCFNYLQHLQSQEYIWYGWFQRQIHFYTLQTRESKVKRITPAFIFDSSAKDPLAPHRFKQANIFMPVNRAPSQRMHHDSSTSPPTAMVCHLWPTPPQASLSKGNLPLRQVRPPPPPLTWLQASRAHLSCQSRRPIQMLCMLLLMITSRDLCRHRWVRRRRKQSIPPQQHVAAAKSHAVWRWQFTWRLRHDRDNRISRGEINIGDQQRR